MISFPDTSFLCALYRGQDNTDLAIAYGNKMREPLHVSSLVLYEFRQSIRFQEYLHEKDKRKGFSRANGQIALANLQRNIVGGMVVIVPPDWAEVYTLAEQLSAIHTSSGGHRSFDILHVATALHLGAKELLTFDANQRKLAEEVGLKAPL